MFTLSSGSTQIFPRMLSWSCPPYLCPSYLSEAPLTLESDLEWSSLGKVLSQRMLLPELQNIPLLQKVQQVVPGKGNFPRHTHLFYLQFYTLHDYQLLGFIGGIWKYLNLPTGKASLGRREKNANINNINEDVLRSLFHRIPPPAWEAGEHRPVGSVRVMQVRRQEPAGFTAGLDVGVSRFLSAGGHVLIFHPLRSPPEHLGVVRRKEILSDCPRLFVL